MKEFLVKTNNEDVEKEARVMNIDVIKKAGPRIEIKNKEDEERAIKLAADSEKIFISCPDWKIIPLENMIAKLRGKTKIIASVKNFEEAKLALETMELGSDGILLETDNLKEFNQTFKFIQEMRDKKTIKLVEATVTNIKQLGLGSRSCLDTCSLMERGEGMLIGVSSQGMFLVEAEVRKNDLAAPRPFRVNAGAVSLYTLNPDNKTSYIEEIKAGDSVLLVNKNGECRSAFIGRSKIEVRPLVLIEADFDGKKAKVILQTAETIRIVTKNGSKQVTELKVGDKVLTRFQEGGRHFGNLVKEETIIEK